MLWQYVESLNQIVALDTLNFRQIRLKEYQMQFTNRKI